MLERMIAGEEDRAEELWNLVRDAEKRIQRICLNLEEATGRRVDQVRVDTRNFANCLTEIFFTEPKR